YDGTNYVGWQVQPNGMSVQAALENALQQILRSSVSTVAAGRTDAGVHARGQVVSFKLPKEIEPEVLVKSLNGVLPDDIAIVAGDRVADDFHARYSARHRTYRYYMSRRPTALERNFSWYVGGYKVEVDLLRQCAGSVMGEHDFASFCKVDSSSEHTRCIVDKSVWSESESKLVYEIRANRFLYGMVRALVGTMVEVARGHRNEGSFEEILAARDRSKAGMSAPAKGLFLEEVVYEGS
ncbi:MAG TPA: tRNA pseudouridine(38-40) synthase TruA, partial [Bacteroidota bacterium]|nr:tRNA pseudouridine(38-40) synthase TruA [Bacteroidota bacterium]